MYYTKMLLLVGLCLAAQPFDSPYGLLAQDREPLRVGGDELKPGLLGVYRSLEGDDAALHRIDPKPAFTLGHGSPHPRIAPGEFEVVWTGAIVLQDVDDLSFVAHFGGDLKLEIDGELLIDMRSINDTGSSRSVRPLRRKPGVYRLKITYRSLRNIPARLQIWWEGKTFSSEPLPAWRLKHLPAELSDASKLDLRASGGRDAVGRLGCARCHTGAFPGVTDPPPGPSLADIGDRVNRTWLLQHLEKGGARMPKLFSDDRTGFVERWIVADYLLRATSRGERLTVVPGDHRAGKRDFIMLGCAACHFVPDLPRDEQEPLDRIPLEGLNDRLGGRDLVAFLSNPHSRYPDGRMPRLPITPDTARGIAAYLQLWSKPAVPEPPAGELMPQKDIDAVAKRLKVKDIDAIGRALVKEKGCAQCHPGIGDSASVDIPLKGLLTACTGARYTIEPETEKAMALYLNRAASEKHPSPFEARRQTLIRYGCQRCHARDTDRSPPIEEAGSTLGGAFLQYIPFLKTPRLSNAHLKYTREYLASTLRDGVSKVRHGRFSYRMPVFGAEAETILLALAEADGDLPGVSTPAPKRVDDPTLAPVGPNLVGFEGYSCVSCHIWKGQSMAEADPGAIGPEMTTVTTRIRKDWFDRWLEDPSRIHPGTPMPQIFKKGQAATLKHFLEGDAVRQREAMWSYLSKGKDAPAPKPLPPLAIEVPTDGPLVAQVPVALPDKSVVEALLVLYPSNDLLVYDVGTLSLRAVFTGARLQRQVRGRLRTYTVAGTPVAVKSEPGKGRFLGYERLANGVRIRTSEGAETWTLAGRKVAGPVTLDLPAAAAPPPLDVVVLQDAGKIEGSLERPGYRAFAYSRPKTASGEDRVMPGAVAADPRDGKVFVASMKTGELFVAKEDGTFENYGGGLFQEAYSMLGESGALYVLHRRNLTRIVDSDGDGRADRFDREVALEHSVHEAYDYGYGLARDKTGAFVMSYAPYGKREIAGAGSMIRLLADGKPEEVAYGFRNPLGWVAGPEGEIFFTDNQGEWVAANKLCHIVSGRYYGFPNSAQKQHIEKPRGKSAIWVPYAWARSINGVTYDGTGGKFGPFAGQIFMAELMYGGGIIRANLERVNGEYQGACFPFWGKGLLGPVVLTFDAKGRMIVGGITEPGWMAQPDRGALFRIEFTGDVPFEIQEIRILPLGFRLVFTQPVDPKSAADLASYGIEHYRYEYTGSYGSPELDRSRMAVTGIAVSGDGKSVDLATDGLVKDKVYLISARGVKSASGAPLVTPSGAYTANEIPK